MAKIYKVKSPAKVNIGLRVLSKRKDGYHNIETIYYPVKIYDEIIVKIMKIAGSGNVITVSTNLKQKIKNEDNICYKTAKVFLEKFRIKGSYRIDIKVKKNIPTGAGLGGGSSDAASVLKILSQYFKNELNPVSRIKMLKHLPVPQAGVQHDKLMGIASHLGSDVAFFMLGKAAYATGRGEKLTPLPEFKIRYKILIVNPGIHISTPWAYKQLGIKNSKLRILNKVKKADLSDERLMINDFERVVFKKYPKIEKIKYDMYRLGADFSLMSGSGSSVYGLFTSRKIKEAKRYFAKEGYKVFEG